MSRWIIILVILSLPFSARADLWDFCQRSYAAIYGLANQTPSNNKIEKLEKEKSFYEKMIPSLAYKRTVSTTEFGLILNLIKDAVGQRKFAAKQAGVEKILNPISPSLSPDQFIVVVRATIENYTFPPFSRASDEIHKLNLLRLLVKYSNFVPLTVKEKNLLAKFVINMAENTPIRSSAVDYVSIGGHYQLWSPTLWTSEKLQEKILTLEEEIAKLKNSPGQNPS